MWRLIWLHLLIIQAELVDYWGYQFEQHHVVTSDGYILGIHRIPGVKGELQTETQKPVVLLGHGMLSSSLQWIFGPSYNSMGYALADAGKTARILGFRVEGGLC